MEEVDVAAPPATRLTKRKSKRSAVRGRTESQERAEELDRLGLSQTSVASFSGRVFLFVFFFMAMVGAVINLLPQKGNDVVVGPGRTVSRDFNGGAFKEVFLLACETSLLALKLWAQLLMAILLPTSHHSFRITEMGFSAMQPSIRASWKLFLGTHWTTKLAMFGVTNAVLLMFLMHREIKRRRYVERLQSWYIERTTAVSTHYNKMIESVRRESKIVAFLLPHVLFFATGFGVFVFAREHLLEFCRGLPGWVMVIGLPIIASARALILYDIAYRKKVEELHGQRKRTFSHLPGEEDAETQQPLDLMGRLGLSFGGMLGSSSKPSSSKGRRSARRGRVGSDASSVLSVDSLASYEVQEVNGIKYPKLLENDPQGSLEQYEELSSVIFWLQYWTVLGLGLLVEYLPVTGHMLAVLPFWPPLRVGWALWLQLPGTAGAALAFRVIVPLVNRYLGEVDTPSISLDQSNMIANALFAFGLISKERRSQLSDIIATGGTVVGVALVFFFMPAVITGIGAIIIGIGQAVVSGTRVLLSVERARQITGRAAKSNADKESLSRFRSNSVSISNCAVQATQWVEYWVIYTIMMLVHGGLEVVLFWFPFYYHGLLAATLWLQLPYFRGAHNLFKVVLIAFYKFRSIFMQTAAESASESALSSSSSGKKNRTKSSKKRRSTTASSRILEDFEEDDQANVDAFANAALLEELVEEDLREDDEDLYEGTSRKEKLELAQDDDEEEEEEEEGSQDNDMGPAQDGLGSDDGDDDGDDEVNPAADSSSDFEFENPAFHENDFSSGAEAEEGDEGEEKRAKKKKKRSRKGKRKSPARGKRLSEQQQTKSPSAPKKEAKQTGGGLFDGWW